MRAIRRAAPWVAWALAFFCSFWPFNFTRTTGYLIWRFPFGELGGAMSHQDFFQHSIAFVLIGAADRVGLRARGTVRALVLPLVVRGVVLCALVEAGQLFLPHRHAELADFALNVGALLVGHVLASPL